MASSKVITSTSPANQDRPRHRRSIALSDQNRNFGSMNIEDLLNNIYDESPANFPPGGCGKTVDEVLKEILAENGGGNPSVEPEVTLEDYLRKNGAVREEDVPKLPAVFPAYAEIVDPVMDVGAGGQFPGVPMQQIQFGNGVGGCMGTSSEGGRGKRKLVVEAVAVDPATQQKQMRMIKNRESAARSRERKMAYTVELESQVTQLEEENARMLKEQAMENKQRLKQLMEKVIPVVEKRRPPRVLRRTNSM